MKEKLPLVIILVLVSFVALANLWRFFWNVSVHIDGVELPGWTGLVAFAVLGTLVLWAARALKRL